MHSTSIKVTKLVNVHVPMLTSSIVSVSHLSLVMTISVRLVCHKVNRIQVVSSMLMIPCGMVKVVVQLAHANAHLTIHRGFANNYLSQLVLIWKPDCAHVIQYRLKTLQ